MKFGGGSKSFVEHSLSTAELRRQKMPSNTNRNLKHDGKRGAPDRTKYLIETTGTGIAFLDYDNDGWIDIFVLSGRLMDGAAPHATNRLYKNNRDGTFTEVTEKAGLLRNGWAMGVTLGDYNNDGFEDIFVTYWGQNVLYRNNGDGTFTDVTKEA
jgi:hypothetical protein